MRLLRNQKGFSLIELMIVVAIIGILAAVAIPNYTRFQNKAKQSEAKGNLLALYTANKTVQAEASAYTSRWDAMGFRPEGALNYMIGTRTDVAPPANFPSQGTATCIRSNAQGGAVIGVCSYGGTVGQWTINAPASTAAELSLDAAAAQTFTFEAKGRINGAADDVWTINQIKTLTNNVVQID